MPPVGERVAALEVTLGHIGEANDRILAELAAIRTEAEADRDLTRDHRAGMTTRLDKIEARLDSGGVTIKRAAHWFATFDLLRAPLVWVVRGVLALLAALVIGLLGLLAGQMPALRPVVEHMGKFLK